jgi:hypothetical protein
VLELEADSWEATLVHGVDSASKASPIAALAQLSKKA